MSVSGWCLRSGWREFWSISSFLALVLTHLSNGRKLFLGTLGESEEWPLMKDFCLYRRGLFTMLIANRKNYILCSEWSWYGRTSRNILLRTSATTYRWEKWIFCQSFKGTVSIDVRGGQANFLKSAISKICKFLNSFRYRKSANFLGVTAPNCKSANYYKILHNSVSKQW